MTDQERPVEERNELPGDLPAAAPGVAVVEAEVPPQQQAIESPSPPTAETTDDVGARAADGGDAPSPQTAGDAGVRAVDEGVASSDGSGGEEAARADASPVTDDAGSASVATSPAEEASYQAPAEEAPGRPRRVKDLAPGMELEGRVTSIALYGIFVDIGVGRDGLVHISEMSDTRIESPSDLVKIGDTVKVRVKSVEPDGRRISLTMRTKERSAEPRSGRGKKKPEVDYEKLAALRVGDNVEGTVTGMAPFGVFVDIGVGKDGLVHVSELAEGRVEKAEDVVQVGQTYTFKVLEVDAAGARISLSLRRAQRGQKLQQLEKGQILEGTISGLAPFGAFVDIGVGRHGKVHIADLSNTLVAGGVDVVSGGDKVQVRVLDVDPQSKRISLSLRLEGRNSSN
jgi:ribosomal protein S1